LLKKFGIRQGSLLEYGCGTGKHAELLGDMGYIVHGVENSTAMIGKIAQKNGFTVQQGDLTKLNLDCTFDAVLAIFHVISYQLSSDGINKSFEKIGRHLEIGGICIFDFWYSPAVNFQRPEIRVKRVQKNDLSIIRVAEPSIFSDQNRVDINYTIFIEDQLKNTIKKVNEKHSMRHFSLPELVLILKEHKLEIVCSEEFLSGNKPSEDTWGVCVVCRKV
jgi:SAM-dependent methyltransferase